VTGASEPDRTSAIAGDASDTGSSVSAIAQNRDCKAMVREIGLSRSFSSFSKTPRIDVLSLWRHVKKAALSDAPAAQTKCRVLPQARLSLPVGPTFAFSDLPREPMTSASGYIISTVSFDYVRGLSQSLQGSSE
jgi:hypothetical protein